MLPRVCAYCRADIDPAPEHSSVDEKGLVSHGICRPCLEEVMRGSGQTMQAFLESLATPVFVVSGDGRVIGANTYARSLVATQAMNIEGRLGGEVFGCTFAKEPGGCGNAVHCESCTIRMSVMETHESGVPQLRREACQDLDTFEGVRQVRFLISTEKAGDAVLLRIDDAQVVEEQAS